MLLLSLKQSIRSESEVSTKELIGRELDAAVAEKVMGHVWNEARCRACGWPLAATAEEGCTIESCSQRPYPSKRADEPAPYSESIEAAMQVAEKFIDTGGRVSMRGMRFVSEGMADGYKPGWRVNFYRFRRDAPPGTRFSFDAESESLPLAICRAALAAIGE
jgi:hypothetical protein